MPHGCAFEADHKGPQLGAFEPVRHLAFEHAALGVRVGAGRSRVSCALAGNDQHDARTVVLRAPQDGIVNILPNFRAQGSFGTAPPAFKEGDRAWTGAAMISQPVRGMKCLHVPQRVEKRSLSDSRSERVGGD